MATMRTSTKTLSVFAEHPCDNHVCGNHVSVQKDSLRFVRNLKRLLLSCLTCGHVFFGLTSLTSQNSPWNPKCRELLYFRVLGICHNAGRQIEVGSAAQPDDRLLGKASRRKEMSVDGTLSSERGGWDGCSPSVCKQNAHRKVP